MGNEVMTLNISIDRGPHIAHVHISVTKASQRAQSQGGAGWTAQCFPAFKMLLEALTSWYSHLHALVSHIYRMCQL